MTQQPTFDVTEAPRTGLSLGGIIDASLELILFLTAASFLIAFIALFLWKDDQLTPATFVVDGLAVGPRISAVVGTVLFGVLTIWVRRNFVAPRRAANKVRAYGLGLPEIRSSLAALRAHADKFRGGWLLLNFAAALAAFVPVTQSGRVQDFVFGLLVASVFVLNGLRLWSDQGGFRKTFAAYVLIAFVWTGFAAAMNALMRASPAPDSLLAFAYYPALAMALWLTERAFSISRASLEDMRRRDRRGPILFLRSFEDDQREFSALFKDALRPYGPFIAIGKPGEFRPDGAARAYFSDSAWRPAVLSMMDDAAVMIVVPGLTSGLDWEMQRLRERGRLRKVLFVLLGKDSDRRHQRLCQCLEGTPEVEQLKALAASNAWAMHVANDHSWITIGSRHTTSGALQAGLDIALYGLLKVNSATDHRR